MTDSLSRGERSFTEIGDRNRVLSRSLVGWVKKEKSLLLLLAGFSILIRLVFVLVLGKSELSWGDEFSYNQLALGLIRSGCFCFLPGNPSVFRAPGYPAFLALVYSIFGENYLAVAIIQAIIGGFAPVLLALIGKQVTKSIRIGLIAGFVFAINPVLLFATNLLYSESIYLTLFLVMVYLWLRLLALSGKWALISLLSGALLGVSLLMRPNYLILPGFLMVWFWIATGKFGKAFFIASLVVLAMGTILLPWSYRNYRITGEIVPVSSNLGLTLRLGNNSEFVSGAISMEELDPLLELSETQRDAVYMQQAIDWIKTHPWRFISIMPIKVYTFFSPLETTNRGSYPTSLTPLLFSAYGFYYLLAVLGFFKVIGKWKDWLLIFMLILYPVIVAAIFLGGSRYGLVAQPYISLLTAVGINAYILQSSYRVSKKNLFAKWLRFGRSSGA